MPRVDPRTYTGRPAEPMPGDGFSCYNCGRYLPIEDHAYNSICGGCVVVQQRSGWEHIPAVVREPGVPLRRTIEDLHRNLSVYASA